MIRSRNNHTTDDDNVGMNDEEELSAFGGCSSTHDDNNNNNNNNNSNNSNSNIGLFKGLFKNVIWENKQQRQQQRRQKQNNNKKSTTTSIFCKFFLLILGIRILFYLCFDESQLPQPQSNFDLNSIPTSSSSSSLSLSSSSSLLGVVTEPETQTQNQTQNTQSRQQYNNSKPTTTTTTTTTIYTLPSSSSSSSSDNNDLEHQLLNHYERDLDWYQNKCLLDNATSYINTMRKYSGSISMKHYTRGCSTSGLHPITHSNPFHTPTHNCSITTSIDIIRTTTTIDHLYESDESWTIQTYDTQKNPKHIGGDTFYIVYYEDEYENGNPNVTSISKPVAVGSKPIDYYNGTYGIENFYQLPFVSASTTTTKDVEGAVSVSKKRQRQQQRRQQVKGEGKIMVYPISTCFIGELYPPLKDEWNTGGSTGNIRWSTSSSTSTSTRTTTSTSTSTADESTIESTTNNVDNDVVGIVKRPFKIIDPILLSSSNNLIDNLPNLKQYNRTIFFGDSIMRQMIYNVFTKQYYHQNNNQDNSLLQQQEEISDRIWMGGGKNNAATNTTTTPKSKDPNNDNDDGPINVNMPLSLQTLPEYIKVMEESIQGGLLLPTPNTTNEYKIALVIGSSAWDIIWPTEWQGPTFQNHLQAVTDLIFYIRKQYPHIYLIWKLPYSNAMYNADPVDCFSRLNNNNNNSDNDNYGSCISALRYASQERFYNVYQKQKQLLTAEDDTTHNNFYNDSHISVIDLYEISYFSGIQWMIPNDSIHYLPDWNRQILQLLYR